MTVFTKSPLAIRKMDTFSFHMCTCIHNSQKNAHKKHVFFKCLYSSTFLNEYNNLILSNILLLLNSFM